MAEPSSSNTIGSSGYQVADVVNRLENLRLDYTEWSESKNKVLKEKMLKCENDLKLGLQKYDSMVERTLASRLKDLEDILSKIKLDNARVNNGEDSLSGMVKAEFLHFVKEYPHIIEGKECTSSERVCFGLAGYFILEYESKVLEERKLYAELCKDLRDCLDANMEEGKELYYLFHSEVDGHRQTAKEIRCELNKTYWTLFGPYSQSLKQVTEPTLLDDLHRSLGEIQESHERTLTLLDMFIGASFAPPEKDFFTWKQEFEQRKIKPELVSISDARSATKCAPNLLEKEQFKNLGAIFWECQKRALQSFKEFGAKFKRGQENLLMRYDWMKSRFETEMGSLDTLKTALEELEGHYTRVKDRWDVLLTLEG